MASEYEGAFEDWEVAMIRNLSSEFVAKYSWLKGLEVDDLMQECLLHWYLVRDNYNAGRGVSVRTYMRQVLRHFLQDILEQQMTDRRRLQHLSTSLEQGMEEGTVSEGAIRTEPESFLRMDLERATQKLSPTQQQICQLLTEGYPITYISRALGRPRSDIYKELKKIREIFSHEGLGEYLR